jgi:hypothetical protein
MKDENTYNECEGIGPQIKEKLTQRIEGNRESMLISIFYCKQSPANEKKQSSQ